MVKLHFAIAITRTCGSGGGSYIAKKLAELYGIDLYDRKLLRLAAEDSGINEEIFAKADENTRKTLLRTVETLHQNALSAQSRYVAAMNSVKSAATSYRLVQEQFDRGMANTVELLTEKNNYLAAVQEQTQAKFEAILSLKLLNFYQNQPIEL